MVMIAELAACLAALIVTAAELQHARRCRRLAPLAFGPGRSPLPWVHAVPALRVLAVAAACWGLVTLLMLPPKVFVAETLPDNERQNLLRCSSRGDMDPPGATRSLGFRCARSVPGAGTDAGSGPDGAR